MTSIFKKIKYCKSEKSCKSDETHFRFNSSTTSKQNSQKILLIMIDLVNMIIKKNTNTNNHIHVVFIWYGMIIK